MTKWLEQQGVEAPKGMHEVMGPPLPPVRPASVVRRDEQKQAGDEDDNGSVNSMEQNVGRASVCSLLASTTRPAVADLCRFHTTAYASTATLHRSSRVLPPTYGPTCFPFGPGAFHRRQHCATLALSCALVANSAASTSLALLPPTLLPQHVV